MSVILTATLNRFNVTDASDVIFRLIVKVPLHAAEYALGATNDVLVRADRPLEMHGSFSCLLSHFSSHGKRDLSYFPCGPGLSKL